MRQHETSGNLTIKTKGGPTPKQYRGIFVLVYDAVGFNV